MRKFKGRPAQPPRVKEWIGTRLFVGATAVGRTAPSQCSTGFTATCALPGGAAFLGMHTRKEDACHAVEVAAASRIRMLFGFSWREITAALEFGPATRAAALNLEAAERTGRNMSPDDWTALRAGLGLRSADGKLIEPPPDPDEGRFIE